VSDTINIKPSTFAWNSILFCRTDTNDAFLEIKTDGTVIWNGRVVESDADFRAAMMEVHQHMCGSANGKLATARAPLAEVERLRAEVAALKAERDALAAQVNALRYPTSIMVRIDDGWITPSNAAHDIARLRSELATAKSDRDEARRWVCQILANPSLVNDLAIPGEGSAKDFAAERGWNCFDAKEVER
jgi:cell division protein FtsB